MHNALSILDVGHGNCAVLCRSGRVVVVDAGPKSGLLEFLESLNITHVDLILISHADADHIGGLVGLISSGKFTFNEIRVNSDSLKRSKAWDDLAFELDNIARNGHVNFTPSLTEQESGQYDFEGIGIEILAPSRYLATKGPGGVDRYERKITSNSISSVIKITFDGEPLALFTGDIDDVGLANLAESGNRINAPILVFPHHGGDCGATDLVQFCRTIYNLVQPKIIIFSLGRDKFNNPKPEIVAALKSQSQDLRMMCTQLSRQCATDLPTNEPEYLDATFSLGREGRKCCTGTIVIPFDNPAALLPIQSRHHAFIVENAPSALCL